MASWGAGDTVIFVKLLSCHSCCCCCHHHHLLLPTIHYPQQSATVLMHPTAQSPQNAWQGYRNCTTGSTQGTCAPAMATSPQSCHLPSLVLHMLSPPIVVLSRWTVVHLFLHLCHLNGVAVILMVVVTFHCYQDQE